MFTNSHLTNDPRPLHVREHTSVSGSGSAASLGSLQALPSAVRVLAGCVACEGSARDTRFPVRVAEAEFTWLDGETRSVVAVAGGGSQFLARGPPNVPACFSNASLSKRSLLHLQHLGECCAFPVPGAECQRGRSHQVLGPNRRRASPSSPCLSEAGPWSIRTQGRMPGAEVTGGPLMHAPAHLLPLPDEPEGRRF